MQTETDNQEEGQCRARQSKARRRGKRLLFHPWSRQRRGTDSAARINAMSDAGAAAYLTPVAKMVSRNDAKAGNGKNPSVEKVRSKVAGITVLWRGHIA